MEATLQKVQQELKSDEWELRVDGLKALTKLGEETKTPDARQQLAKLLKQALNGVQQPAPRQGRAMV